MYFTKVEIENYGCIERLDYEFRFNKNGLPIPLILIGPNGSGKSLVLANLVDSLIEHKRNVYGDKMLETEPQKYFKLGSKNYIRKNQQRTRTYVEIKNDNNILKYFDIVSYCPQEDIEKKLVHLNELNDINAFKEDGFSKKAEGKVTRSDFNKSVNLYFPVDRYYVPMWYNPLKERNINYPTDNFIDTPKTNIIKNNILLEIKDWLSAVFLEKSFQKFQIANDNNMPEDLRGKWIDVLVSTPLQNTIMSILSTIKGSSVVNANNTIRSTKYVGFSGTNFNCLDISQLSEGEMNLFALAVAIIKDWDFSHQDINLKEIEGTVIVDEADLGLHIDYAYRAFPALMKLFPKVQFILTSHSPFLLAGLVECCGDELDVLIMPTGTKITDVSSYCEIQKAIKIVQRFNLQDAAFKREKDLLEQLLKNVQDDVGKIYIYTEGKTDELYLDAVLKDQPYYSRLLFNPNLIDKDFGDANLHNRYEQFQTVPLNNIKIFIFDRDNERYIVNDTFEVGKNHTYKFSIPVPKFRNDADKISIEHYFKDEEIKTADEDGHRLFLAGEFNKQGRSLDDKFFCRYTIRDKDINPLHILDGRDANSIVSYANSDANIALSKMKFAKYVVEKRDGFIFNMDCFKQIIEILDKIVLLAETEQ